MQGRGVRAVELRSRSPDRGSAKHGWREIRKHVPGTAHGRLREQDSDDSCVRSDSPVSAPPRRSGNHSEVPGTALSAITFDPCPRSQSHGGMRRDEAAAEFSLFERPLASFAVAGLNSTVRARAANLAQRFAAIGGFVGPSDPRRRPGN